MSSQKEKKHLPYTGVGPYYGFTVTAITAAGIFADSKGYIPFGEAEWLKAPLAVIGTVLIMSGLFIWGDALFRSKIDAHIESNKLATSGAYAYVRNPIYSAIMIISTGTLLWANNLVLLVLPLVYWALLTVMVKNTEEKWLHELYGSEYDEYCKRVNRCIPWFGKR